MKKLHDINTLINDCNIILEYQDLPHHLLGVYHGDAHMDLIIINQSITDDDILHKIILAEELGHYFTTIGNNTPKKYARYSDRLKVDKCEEKALRWSLNYLIPTTELIELLCSQEHMTIETCSTYFEVPEDFMIHKFELMAKEKLSWPLDRYRYLILSNLPSIFIMDTGSHNM